MNAVEKDSMSELNTSLAVYFNSDLPGLALRRRESWGAARSGLFWWPSSAKVALDLLL